MSVLLPRETIFVAHMPDFNQTRDQWRQSDIYKLYREPEVQNFLHKPLANLSTPKAFGAQTLLEFEQLAPKNVFFALTSLDDNSPKLAGGFRFQGSIADAERVIGKWRSKFLERNPGARREKLHYEHHEIDLVAATPFTLATAYDRPWFFAATDLTELKGLLDRADGRVKNPKETLDEDEAYRAAISHRPSNYALFFYLQPKTFAARLAALRAAIQSPAATQQQTILEQVRSISGATRLEGGRIYDLLFVGMPRLESRDGATALTRSSLTLGTKETFFYLSMLLNLGERMETLNQAAGLSGMMQRFAQAFSDSGITVDDWKAAFGLELGSLADWPSSAHWPTLLLTLPVLDVAKAGKDRRGRHPGRRRCDLDPGGKGWSALFFDAVTGNSRSNHPDDRIVGPAPRRRFQSGLSGRGGEAQRKCFVRTFGVASLQERRAPGAGADKFFRLYRHPTSILPARCFASPNVIVGGGFYADAE